MYFLIAGSLYFASVVFQSLSTPYMPDQEILKKLIAQKKKARSRILELRQIIRSDLEQTFQKFYEGAMDTYFTAERKIENFETLLQNLSEQIDAADATDEMVRIIERLEYVEDQIDEFAGKVFRRTRKRIRNRSRFFDFFKKFSEENANGSSAGTESKGEVRSIAEAYAILNLEEGVGMTEVLKMFRRLAKQYHPDVLGGDQRNEKKLRKTVEAYQIIKQHLITTHNA